MHKSEFETYSLTVLPPSVLAPRAQHQVNFTGAPHVRRLPCASKPYIDTNDIRQSVELSYGGIVQSVAYGPVRNS